MRMRMQPNPWQVSILAVLLLVGCSGSRTEKKLLEMAVTNAATIETIAASDFLVGLHKQGRLPGDSKDDHGEVKCKDVPVSNPRQETYPISRTFDVVKNGGQSTYHYTVVRLSKGSEWQLQRAWRSDAKGDIVEEW